MTPRSRLLSLALAALTGCGGLVSPSDADGGTGGGSATGVGGGTAGGSGTGGGSVVGGGAGGGAGGGGGGGGTGGGTAGGAGGGGGGTGGGTAGGTGGGTGGGTAGGTGGSGGGRASFQFSSLAVPAAPFGIVKGLSGNPGGELWAVSDNGRAYRRPVDAGFVEITGFTSGFSDVYAAPNGAVFLVSTPRTTRTCLANCTTAASFTDYLLPTSNLNVVALCGSSSTNVYAVGKREVAAFGVLYRWDGTVWTQLSNNLGVENPLACYLRSDGVLFIAGQKDILRWEQGAGTVETAGLDLSILGTEATAPYWNGIHGLGTAVIAVGNKRRSLIRDPANGTWSLASNPQGATNALYTVAYLNPDEIYAAGSKAPNLLYASDGGTVFTAHVPDLPVANSIRRILVLGPNEIYFGGGAPSGGDPVIIRGTR